MTQNIKMKPSAGVYVSASYVSRKKTSSYRARFLGSGETIANQNFKNITTSANIMAFIGICEALKYCSKNDLRDELIFSNNLTAITWCKTKKHGSKVLDKRTLGYVNAAISTLRANDFTSRICFWDTALWGNPVFNYFDNEDDLPF